MSKLQRKTKKQLFISILAVIAVLIAGTVLYLHYHTTTVAKTPREQACERAAREPVNPLEGMSVDQAICDGTFQQTTPAQSK